MLCHIYIVTILKHVNMTEMAFSFYVFSILLMSGDCSFVAIVEHSLDFLLRKFERGTLKVSRFMAWSRWLLRMAKFRVGVLVKCLFASSVGCEVLFTLSLLARSSRISNLK